VIADATSDLAGGLFGLFLFACDSSFDDTGNVIETHEHTVQRVLSSRFSLARGISLCLARISHPVCDDDHQGIKS
jgi:hypothetical protein